MNAGKNVDTCFFAFQNGIYSNGNAKIYLEKRRKEKGGLWKRGREPLKTNKEVSLKFLSKIVSLPK